MYRASAKPASASPTVPSRRNSIPDLMERFPRKRGAPGANRHTRCALHSDVRGDGGMAAVSGRTMLVTGATDGIGRATARRLLELGATVLLHGRDSQRVTRVAGDLWKETGSDHLDVVVADLSSIEEVRWLVELVRR